MKNYQAMLKLILSCPQLSEADPLERDLSKYFNHNYTYWLNDLKGQKLVSDFTKLANYEGHGKNLWIVRLTDEGLHYFDKRKEDNRRFWFRSFLIPIVVAFITTLLTNAVAHLF